MATTTNFGWETPDDTDLVKDGALAIRTLGSAIDTSLVDLKGGTTGQVLSKNSNTDMDFTWVTSDDANAIQNTIVDAKGDLISASASDVPARLAVGNNGETLVADSSASTGLRWQGSQAGGRNAIINGGMDFWQRGTSFTSASVYTADRWFKGSQAGCTVSRQTANLEGFQYSMRVQRDSGTTNVNGMGVYHNIETQESLRFAGKTIVISFYAKAGANYSPTSSLLNYIVYTGTGTDQARTQSVAFTGEAQPASGTVTLTTSWQRFSFTANIASTATEICFVPYMANTGTAGANDWFEITGVQLQLGSVPTVFSRAGGTLAGELVAAMRYCEKLEVAGSSVLTTGQAYSTTAAWGGIQWTVQKRATPTITQTGTFQALQANTATSGTTFTYATIGTNNARMSHASGTGLVAGNACIFQASGDASLLITAEL